MNCSGWMSYALSDIAEYSKEKISIDKVNKLNYISTENMLQDKKGVVEASSIPSSNSIPAYEAGDTLISNIRPYFKKIWFANGNGGASTDVLVIKNKNRDIITDRFLYYTMFQDKFFDYIMSGAKGTKMPRGDKSAIMKYQVTIPNIDEQNKITNIFENLDKKIELNNEMNKTLAEMAQALFKRWFIDFEFPNKDGEPYKSSGGEMVETEFGAIPNGWNQATLGEMISITSGKRPKKKQSEKSEECNIPLIGASTIMGYVGEVLYDEKLLVIGRVGTHGVVQRINYPSWPSDNTLVIKTENTEFVYQILNIIDYKSLNRGSTQPLITQGDIKEYKIIIPESKWLNEFEIVVGNIFKIVEANINENIELIQLRDSLLPKLMSGEIRVEDIEANL